MSEHIHIEITKLIIPSENDSLDDTRALATFVAEQCSEDVPLHLSAYFPRYQLQRPATTEETVFDHTRVASEQLHYVYAGNVGGSQWSDTKCTSCKSVLISRQGYSTDICAIEAGSCAVCGESIAVIQQEDLVK